jgi:hypothetical protein
VALPFDISETSKLKTLPSSPSRSGTLLGESQGCDSGSDDLFGDEREKDG